MGFDPQVFKKNARTTKSKGVDVTLTKDVLSHAFLNNYDQAVLIAGDGDFVPLLEEVKRVGRNIYVAFFGEEHGLARELRLAADRYYDFTRLFLDNLAAHIKGG